jgi:hypothetical protein
MNQYIHHIPGRVRIKNPMFQNNTVVLDRLRRCLDGISGVDFITTNPFTGSLVVNYDCEVVDQEHLMHSLLFHINRQAVPVT